MGFRRTRCAHCRTRFEPKRYGQVVHEECAADWAIAEREKEERKEEKRRQAEAKVQRALDRKKREQLKTIPQLTKEAQLASMPTSVRATKPPATTASVLAARWTGLATPWTLATTAQRAPRRTFGSTKTTATPNRSTTTGSWPGTPSTTGSG